MPRAYRITWSGDALDTLVALLAATQKAEGNPEWVERKFEQCVQEGVRRLELFPDLRIRYVVDDIKCSALTLRTLPLQLFYRRVDEGEIAIFDLRWAVLDETGPREP